MQLLLPQLLQLQLQCRQGALATGMAQLPHQHTLHNKRCTLLLQTKNSTTCSVHWGAAQTSPMHKQQQLITAVEGTSPLKTVLWMPLWQPRQVEAA